MPPFKADSLEDIKKSMKSTQIRLKDELSKETKNLMKNLLRVNVTKRYDIDYVLAHPVFKKFKNTIESSLSE